MPRQKISNVNQLPNFAPSGGANPLPINTKQILDDISQGGNEFQNANLKKISPDGALEFFDDNQIQEIPAAPLTGGQAPTGGTQPLQSAQGVPSPSPSLGQGGGGGFGEFVQSPQFRQLLAQLGLSLSASRPTSFASQLSQFALQDVQSDVFGESLEELLNPSQPESGGGLPSNLSLLPPEQQLAVIQQAEGIRASRRGEVSADVTDRLNTARTIDLLRGDESGVKTPSSRVETFKTLPNGKSAPAGFRFRMGFNNDTGKFDIFQGLIDENKAGDGGGTQREVKVTELRSLQENLIAAFDKELIEGIESRFGTSIANAGQLLNFLRTAEGDFDIGTARVALAENPDVLNEFNDLIAKGTSRLLTDELPDIGDIIRDISREGLSRDSRTKQKVEGF